MPLWLFLAAALHVWGPVAEATPPDYTTFQREQRRYYTPNADDLLRIWVVYVGQGDGILIQLPRYDPDVGENNESISSERIDILIDGGSNNAYDAQRIARFLGLLYDHGPINIEHAVITHHDKDHVLGLIKLLEQDGVRFATIYHNGLASYKPGQLNFPRYTPVDRPAVYTSREGQLTRGMAFLDAQDHLDDSYLINSLNDLNRAFHRDELQGLYEDLARAVLKHPEVTAPLTFQRAYAGAPFIADGEPELNPDASGLRIDVLWPREKLEPYAGRKWSETINGNSVTFRLVYGDFAMLFTGDLNKHSEEAMLEYYRRRGELGLLNCDVLKVPHHGSAHAHEPFFTHPDFRPVISVASMGHRGFQSKAMNSQAWQHPSTDVIRWLGRAHRFYSTYIHERRFKWSDITDESIRRRMIERTHILIETDGKWFRVVELPFDNINPNNPPTVRQTRRGNGTRWIKAKERE